MDQVTNVTFFVTKLRSSTLLPSFIVNNKAVVSLECDKNSGLPYNDNLCFFRCLAVHNGCHTKNLERDTSHYFERFMQTRQSDEAFRGVTLEELPDLEKRFEVNIFVYTLEKAQPDGEVSDQDNSTHQDRTNVEITARLLQRSHCKYNNTMYLNLYKNHFSYIKNINRYSKSFSCNRCQKMWKHVGKLHRHERTCDAQVKLKFPGGAYNLPPSIFDQLEDEGISVPHNMRYYPYFAVFDFECFFDEADVELKNTEKLHWKNKHKPLSVSVSSNVPGFDRPHCIVSSGNEDDLAGEMVDYLVGVSEESYRILEEEFKDVFEAIDNLMDEQIDDFRSKEFEEGEMVNGAYEVMPSNVEMDEEMDNGAIDLMSSDAEFADEEMIESETDEDRAFLNDEAVDEQNTSFYNRIDNEKINNEADQQPLKDQDTSDEQEKSTPPLLNLKGKLWGYLKTLPVLGFNSGKYDINAVKEFIFPHLVSTNPLTLLSRETRTICL